MHTPNFLKRGCYFVRKRICEMLSGALVQLQKCCPGCAPAAGILSGALVIIVCSAFIHQLPVGSLFNDSAIFHHKYQIRIPDRGQSVGDHERSSALCNGFDRFLDRPFRHRINGRSCLVQYQQTRVRQYCPCERPVERDPPPSPIFPSRPPRRSAAACA